MNIVIFSRNPFLYSTNSLVRAAQRRNHDVTVIDHMQCDLIVDNKEIGVYHNGQRLENVQAIIPRIGASATYHGASIIRQFEYSKVYTTMSSDALLRCRDKLICLQMLAGNGIAIPKSIIANNYEAQSMMLDKIGAFPIVLKFLKGTHGLGVILSENKKNAESILEAFQKSNLDVMVQEFIKEAGGSDIRVFIVDDEIVGVMKRQAKEGEFRSNLHRGASSTIDTLTDDEKNTALNAAKIMGLKIAGVDMLRSKRGALILEVNASPGLEGIETTTSVDIAGKIITMVERYAKAEWRR